MNKGWKEIKLKELGSHYGGLTNKSKENFGKGKPYIPYLNIFQNGKIDLSFIELVEIFTNEHQNKVKQGDIFFTTSSETPEEVGMTSVLIDDCNELYLNSFCFGFRLSNFDNLLPEFAVYLFRSEQIRKNISDLAQGSTRYNLSKSIFFEKLKLNLPPLPQQKKIAKILSTVDEVIEKTEQAIAKYQAIKQGLMQDLFTRGIDPKTGKLRPSYQNAPELYKPARSEGGESALGMIPKDWEVEELGSVGDVKMCKRIFSSQTKSEGDIPFYKIGTFGKKPNSFISKRLYKEFKSKYSFPSIGSILISASGTIGRLVIYDGEDAYFQDSNIVWIENNNLIITNRYLKYIFPNVQFKTEGGTIKRLYNNILKSGLFTYPLDTKEQNIIVEKLETIDQKISTEQSSLAKYAQLKKGLMQDLLTGKVNV